MEIHERFMKLPTTEVDIAKIITGNCEPKIVDRGYLINKLKKLYDSKITSGDLDLKTLETYRTILCYEYQLVANVQDQVDHFIFLRQEHTDLRRYFAKRDGYRRKEEFSVLCDIVVLLLGFTDYPLLMDSFKQVLDVEGDPSTMQSRDLAMRIVECFADSYNLRTYWVKPSLEPPGFEELFARILTIIQLWLKQEEDLDWKLLASLLPKLCITFEPGKIVPPLWSQIIGTSKIAPPFLGKGSSDIADLDKKLTALCVMADVCFPLETVKVHEFHYEQCAQNEFWWILYQGLTSKVPQQRKQALYLAKRAIEFAANHESEMKRRLKPLQKTAMPFVCPGSKAPDSSVGEAKKNFFLILEVLEEKQKHLVLPALSHLPSLAKIHADHESCCDCFNPIWLRCTFKRITQHDNETVKIFGLREILRSDPHIFLDDEFLLYLVDALNSTFLYEIEGPFTAIDIIEKKPPIVRELEECLVGWERKGMTLINSFVRALPSVSWGPVAIYWILEALLAASERCEIVVNAWGEAELRCVEELTKRCLTMHNLELRTFSHDAVTRMFRAYVSTPVDPSILDRIFGILFSFPQSEIAFRESIEWDFTAEHLSKIIASSDAVGYITQRCDELLTAEQDLRSFALAIAVLLDSGLIIDTWSCLVAKINDVFQSLVGADMRPYANQDAVLRVIGFWGHLMLTISNPKSAGTTKLEKLLSPYDDEIIKIVMRSLERKTISSYDEYLFVISALVLCYRWNLRDENVRCWMDVNKKLDGLEEKCINIIANPHNYSRTQWSYAVKMFHIYRYHIPCDRWKKLGNTFIPLLLKYFRTEVVGSGQENAAPQNDGSKEKFASDCAETIAKILYQCIGFSPLDSWPSDVHWCQELLALVETGNELVIEPVAATLRKLLDRCWEMAAQELDAVNSIVRVSWRSVFQLKKTDDFYSALKELTMVMLSPAYLKLDGTKEYAVEYVDHMMREGETVPLVKQTFMEGALFLEKKDMHLFHKALMSCLLHGTVPRRDQRIERATILRAQQMDDAMEPYSEDAEVRAHAVAYILLENLTVGIDDQIRENIFNDLLEILEKNTNKRYFDNSHLHRLKNRVMQALLIMEPFLNQTENQRLYDALCDLLISESNQPSVRLMHEWLLIRLYLKDQCMRETMWTLFETAAEKRPGSIVSLASVVFHVARLLSGQTQTEYIAKAISRLLPNCMGQQFSVRLYSQSILVKIYEMLPKDSPEAKTYEEIFKGVEESLRRGNLMKNSSRVLDDFYFKIFEPVLDYNVETIFGELPRLTNLSIDEWVLPGVFDYIYRHKYSARRKFVSTCRYELQIAKPSLQSSKPTGDLAECADSSMDGGLSDIQKKIIPWKSMVPLYDELSEVSKTKLLRRKRENEEAGIIVVASLIDRPPNLGGLARTCEIFGAKELVIGSLRYAEDREFQTLSVSAEKWITITEVKPHLLQNYLLEKHYKEWKLVGAEQTANSKNLLEMDFPKKTILLLGNEKDGIPANLIPLLDTCVEIPQNGVVRSLNVHVTGAICIWQYAKQHVLM